ncbi:MAG: hypothetical protein LRY71_09690 [Bacillaceae bacterium]|nr:hypothetical protein [Bacillaceae bacterium]
MSDLNKDVKRALNDTVFSTNPYDPAHKTRVMHKIKEKNSSQKIQGLTPRFLPLFSLSAAVFILVILGANWFQGGVPNSSQEHEDPQLGAPLDEEDTEEEPVEEKESPVYDEEEKIRQMIGKETESEPDTIYGDDARLPIHRVDEADFTEGYFNVDHFLIDGIDSNNVGYLSEAGFVSLTRASHMLVGSSLPSINYRQDLITIDDAFSVDQVVDLKKQFDELTFIFPAGKYFNGELTQATFLIHSENEEETFMKEVLIAIKSEFPDVPVTILFTAIEDDHFLTKYAIGYFNKELQIQFLDGLVSGPNEKLSEHLSTEFDFVFDETINGYRNTFNLIQAQGITNERVGFQLEPSTDPKTLSLLIYGVTRLDMDNVESFIEDILQETYAFYNSTDIAIEIYINNDEQWDGKFEPEKAIIVFPNEEEWFIYEF